MTETGTMDQTAASLNRSNPLAELMLRVVDLLIAALIFLLPFIMGGREAWGHWFLITTAFLLAAAWSTYAVLSGARYAFSWLEYFFLAGLAIAWFQVQPQSTEALQTYSPEYTRLLAFWSETQPADSAWASLSFTPRETRHAFWVFVAYSLIGIVVFQRARTMRDCERLLKCVGACGLAMTIFGLWQWGLSNGNFFWFYEHPYTDTTVHLKGAFTNRNHFAQFLTLSLGPLLWWLVSEARHLFNGTSPQTSTFSFGRKQKKKKKRSKRRELPPVQSQNPNKFDRMISLPIVGLLAAVCLVGIGVLMSLSRGGMIALAAVSLISGIGLWRGLKMGSAAVVVVMSGSVLFLTLLAFTDQTELQTKIDQLLSSDADEIDSGGVRRAIWAADAKIIRQFPWLGTGVGSHRDVYPLYMDNYADHASAVMTHAESSFVHVALETGLVGFGVLAVGLLFLLAKLSVGYFGNSTEKQACTVIVLACAIGGILHGIVDFIWYAPAIVVTSLVLVVVGVRTSSHRFDTPDSSQGLWFPRMAWATIGGCCLIGLVTVQADLFQRIDGEKHWYASLRTKLDNFDDVEELAESEEGDAIVLKDGFDLQKTPKEQEVDDAAHMARRIAAQKQYLVSRIRHLSASLKAFPEQHRVQLDLAEQVIKLFDVLQVDNDLPFSLSMLRDAASAGFENVDELQSWLNTNCNGRVNLLLLASRLSKQSLSECPLQGYAYLNLMKVAFTEGISGPDHQHLIDQALMVRGHDPRIRLAVGKEALVAGDQQRALDLFQTVFHSNQRFRLEIIQQWAAGAHAEFFLAQFEPNGEELEDLLIVYDLLERERDSNTILQRLFEVLPVEAPEIEDDDERLEALMKAYGAGRRLEQLEASVDLLKSVINEFPFAFEPRYHLGMTLVELERGAEAMEHLKWCYDQDPSHVYVQQQIQRATKQKHALPEDDDNRLSQL